MTTVAASTSRSKLHAVGFSGSASRRALAVLAPVAPALIAVLRLVLPYDTTDSSTTALAKVSAHVNAQRAVVILGTIAVLLVIPAYLAVARLTREHAPALTAWALVCAIPGYVGLALLLQQDQLLLSAATEGTDPATATALLNATNGSFMAGVGGVAFVAGHIVGTVLLGIALYRSRRVPRWAAWAIIVSQPLHLVFAVVVVSHPLDFAAWSLTALGFGVAGLRAWTAGKRSTLAPFGAHGENHD